MEKQQTSSLASLIASLPDAQRKAALSELTEEECAELLYDWRNFWARPNQIAPDGDWTIWLLMTGRGFGKTRAGAEWVRECVEKRGVRRIALVGATAADVRDTMVEGESGILECCPPTDRPNYEPSKRRLTWPNGAVATTFSADQPDRLRGPQHEIAWCDELAAWRYLREAWDNLMLGLRIGNHPRCCITTTPKPLTLLKEIIERPDCEVTRGSTYDNRTNLAPTFFREIVARYKGTRTGRQEILGEYLDDVEGALWTRAIIDETRVDAADVPDFLRVVIAVDPAVSAGEDSSLTGIVPCAVGTDRHLYVLADYSGRYGPTEWAEKVVWAYDEHSGDRIVGEVNNGGDLVEANVRNVRPQIPFTQVRATRGKAKRAEPIAALWEQGRAHIVGSLPDLEDQLCMMVPGEDPTPSPDRADAMVWGGTELLTMVHVGDAMHGIALPTNDDLPDDEDEAA